MQREWLDLNRSGIPGEQGRTRVLVAEDEAILGIAMGAELRRLGLEVHLSGSGAQALKAFEACGPFDLLITDLGMPQMRGEELIARIREARPALPILVITAYDTANLPLPDGGLGRVLTRVLTKPVPTGLLEAAIAELLHTARSAAKDGT